VSRGPVVAGGGVLWRGESARPEVALVHRPRYDDWSLPKGKAKPGEHLLLTAVREVAEETGSTPLVGPQLTTTRYRVRVRGRSVDKLVTYWSMEHRSGDFQASDEVDEIRWLPVAKARARLTKRADVSVLDAFVRSPRETTPLLLIRNGPTRTAAGRRAPHVRYLTDRGREQADRLVPLLDALGVGRLRSADTAACTATLRPYARVCRLTVEVDTRLARDVYAAHRRRLSEELRGTDRTATQAVCAPRAVVADLVSALARGGPVRPPHDPAVRKGGWWLLHLTGGQVQALERHDPVV
jgi:8-oxo-dGTP diphosphatase